MTESIEIRRKRLLFRSSHRGTKEADLLLGNFAERNLASFDSGLLDAFERLLDIEDPDLWDWMTGHAPPPPQYDTEMLTRLRNFRYIARPA